MQLIIALLLLLGGCAAHNHYVSPTLPPGCVLKGGVEEPYYPPYVWVQPPGEKLWYPGGQCLSDEEIGLHGH